MQYVSCAYDLNSLLDENSEDLMMKRACLYFLLNVKRIYYFVKDFLIGSIQFF